MPIINTWVPSAFVVLLTVLTMFTLLVFERKTRVGVLHVAAVLIGIFSCYQLYSNIEAGLDFVSNLLFLIVGIVAIAVCEKVATFEQMKMVKGHEESEKTVEEKPLETVKGDNVSSTDAEQLEEISALRAQSQTKETDDLEKDKAMVLAWFNKQIVHFTDAEQLNLRKYAEAFLSTGEIAVRTIPENNGNYTQQSITKICSAFRIAGMSREACAHFAKTIFSAFYPDTMENTIGKKFVGIPKMREIIEESL